MERISSKLKISFSNVEVLSKDLGWKMLADVEGSLKITIEDKLFFDEESILLLELALALMKWIEMIESGKMINFYYESMDYEDQPILAFMLNDNNSWRLYSIWEIFADKNNLSLKEITHSVSLYIDELLVHLKNNFEFDFRLFLQSEKTLKL
ncbi:MAG: hypothetical protein ACRC2S_15040 [Waterburya sp.]